MICSLSPHLHRWREAVWVCFSTSNISLLAQSILVHTIIGNVVDMWNICMAFWEVDWNRTGPGRYHKYPV